VELAPVSVLKTGTLNKLRKGLIKSWKKRYFVLTDQARMDVYQSQESWLAGDKARQSVDLTDCSIGTAQHHTGKTNSFGIFHPKRSDTFLQAPSESELLEWIHIIETRCLGVEDTVKLHDFELLALVGSGAFGKVIQVKKKDTGRIYALKVLSKKDVLATNQMRATETERRVLEVVNHPFIVKLFYAFQTTDKLCFVLDFVNGGDIFSLIKQSKRLPESDCMFYSAQLVMALEYLHEMDIIYRDLKPENVLLDKQGYLKLTDFGLSKDAVQDRTYTIVGSPYYIAPEIVLKQGHSKVADWWSLGILCYEMVVGLPPFYSDNFHMSYRRLLEEPLQFPRHTSEICCDLLRGLLKIDPRSRLGSGEDLHHSVAQDIRQHAFYKTLSWDKLLAKQLPPPYIPDVSSDRDVSHFELAASREGALLSEGDGHGHFEGFGDYMAPSTPLADNSDAVVEDGALQRFKSTPHHQCPVMVAATEYLDDCSWDYHRAVQGLILAILNREVVLGALAPDQLAQSER